FHRKQRGTSRVAGEGPVCAETNVGMFLLNRGAVKNAPGRPLTPAPIPHTVPLMVATLNNFVWHDQFKTSVLAQAATADWSGGVMENWSDASAKCLPNTPALQHSTTPFFAGGVVELD